MKPRVAICHPSLGRGGSEARALWLLQTLRGTHEPTLVTLGEVDLESLNRYYGTSLRATDFSISRPTGGRWLSRHAGGAALRGALLSRYLRKHAAKFDLCVSSYNPVDFGRPGVQFVADFSFLPEVRRRLDGDTSGLEGSGLLRSLGRLVYGAATAVVRGSSERDAVVRSDDVLIANSQFTAGVLKTELGRDCDEVVYPPVQGPLGGRPVEQRDATFVSLGRISSEKRVEEQIEILRGVRSRGHDVKLRILGGPTHGSYPEKIRSVVDAESEWVKWEGWAQGEAKWSALAESRFAIHCRQGEAFGISVAEMARAGCITFVPRTGGPSEIVGAPELVFEDADEAASRISCVIEDADLQRRLSDHLIVRGRRFSTDRFSSDSKHLIASALG